MSFSSGAQKTCRFENLLELLIEKTRIDRLVDGMKNFARINDKDGNPRFPVFSKNFAAAESAVEKLCADFYVRYEDDFKAELPPNASQVEYLLWYLMLLPCGAEAESEVKVRFAGIKLTPLKGVYRDIFAKLMAEALYEGYNLRGVKQKYYDQLLSMIDWIDKTTEASMTLETGLYKFFRTMQDKSPYFHNFALAISRFFIYKWTTSLESDVRKQSRTDIRRFRSSIDFPNVAFPDYEENNLQKRYETFPPFWDVLVTPITVMKDGLLYADGDSDSDGDLEEFTPARFFENVERKSMERNDVNTTIRTKLGAFRKFCEVTKNHGTIWREIEKKHLEHAVEESVDDDATSEQKLFVKIVEGVEIDYDPSNYLKRIIAGKYMEKLAESGIVRLRYRRDNPRFLTPDKICMFIGFLESRRSSLKSDWMISAFIRVLLSGSGIRRAMQNYTAPHGALYSDLSAEVGKFRADYPDFAFNASRAVYTARAVILDSDAGVTPIDAAYWCGSLLPGMRSSVYYVCPSDSSAGKIAKLNAKYLKELLIFARTGFAPPLDKYNSLINMSVAPLQKALDALKNSGPPSPPEWAAVAPALLDRPEKDMESIYESLKADFISAQDQCSKIVAAEALASFVMMSALLMRPAEMKNLRSAHVSFRTAALYVAGKGNKEYMEERILPIPLLLAAFLARYKDFMKSPTVRSYTFGLRRDYLFPCPEDSLKSLRSAMHGVDANYEPYHLRRTGATYMHNRLGTPFELLQAAMGHSQVGHEFFGAYSRTSFGRLRDALERYSRSSPLEELLTAAARIF